MLTADLSSSSQPTLSNADSPTAATPTPAKKSLARRRGDGKRGVAAKDFGLESGKDRVQCGVKREAEDDAEGEPGPGTIGFLRRRIEQLENSESSLRDALHKRTKMLEELLNSGRRAKETMKRAQGMLSEAIDGMEDYRRWWMKEHEALQAVLAHAPPRMRARLGAVAKAARGAEFFETPRN